MVGAEAGDRARVGMASSGASADSAGARVKRQAGRGGDEINGGALVRHTGHLNSV